MVDMLRKSIVALLLVLVATYVPCYALQGTWGSLTWQLSKDSTVLAISGTGYMKESFSSLPFPWVQFGKNVKTLVLSEGIKNVAASGFSGFAQLSTLNLPSSISDIGKFAFSGCSSLESVSIPSGVTCLPIGVFRKCSSLVSVDIPNTVTTIERSAFNECTSLASVHIPGSVTFIGEYAFQGCKSLVTCENESENVDICCRSFEGCPLPVEDGVSYVGKYAVACNRLLKGDICLKEGTLGMAARFDDRDTICSKLVLPKSLTYLKYKSISKKPLFETIVLFSRNLKMILKDDGQYRQGIPIANQIVIEDGVRVIPALFYTDEFNNGIYFYPYYGGYKTESLTLPESVEIIGDYAFFGSRLSSINIPKSVKKIGKGAFWGSSLISVNIPNGVEIIDQETFKGCSFLSLINVPNSVKTISSEAFSFCSSLPSVNLPDNLDSICDRAFQGCSFLSSIKIPQNLNFIGDYVFQDCNSLPLENGNRYADVCLTEALSSDSLIVVKAGTRFISSNAFTPSGGSLNGPGWVYSDIVLPESVEVIGMWAFSGQTALKSINIPSSLRVVESYVFGSRDSRCLSLETINLSNLASWCRVDFGESNPLTWGAKLMMDGKPLEGDLDIPEGVDSIGSNAFYNQEGITSVSLPANVQKVGKSAFYGAQLKSVVSRQTNPEKYEDAFSETTYLHCPLYVPDGTYWNYVYKSGWGRFAHIKEYATEAQSVSENKVYMLSDARGYNYSVYDEDSGSLKTVEYAHKLDEDSKDNCWQVIKYGGRSYLYSLGAKRYAAVGEDKQLHLVSAPVDMDIAETKDGLSIDGKPCMFVLTDVLPTAIEDIHATATNREVQSIYSLEAPKEPSTRKGINIVRYNDGSSQKIMIK